MTEISSIEYNNYIQTDCSKSPSSVKNANEDSAIEFSSDSKDLCSVDKTMNVIAHRGYSTVAPENTIPAFIAAAENGFKTVECDIEWTKDSVPVLLHDSTINRTARKENGKKLFFPKKCSRCTYEKLLKYDFGSWMGEEFKGTKIPTFQELLDCSEEYDLNVYVELKKSSGFDEEKAKILTDAVKEAGLEDKITWISFEDDYLQEIKDIMPEARLGYLSKETPDEDTIDILQDLQTDENEVFLDVKASEMSKDASEMLNESGFDFETWTVNDSKKLDDLYMINCKAITTDSMTETYMEEYNNSRNEDDLHYNNGV